MAGIVGTPAIELEKAYRKLLLKIVNELRLEECEQIAFLAKLPAPTCQHEAGRQYDNVRLHFMSTLESLGHVGPLKLEYLEDCLIQIGKKNLVELVTEYKLTPAYSEVKQQEKLIRRKERKLNKRSTISAVDSSTKVKGSLEAALLSEYQSTYSLFLTQMSQMTLMLRKSLESHELQKVRETFLKASTDGEAIMQSLRPQGFDTSSSSGEDTADSALSTPTDENRNLPTPPARKESLKVPNSANSATPDSSPSPPLRKRPVPVPRKKLPQSKSVHSQAASPLESPTNTGQQTEGASTSAVVRLPPHSAPVYTSGDYSGSASDSGYGGGIPKYVPSQERLEQLNPDSKTELQVDECSISEDLSKGGYMKLIGRQEPTSDRYAKMVQTKMDGVDGILRHLDRIKEEMKD